MVSSLLFIILSSSRLEERGGVVVTNPSNYWERNRYSLIDIDINVQKA